MKVYSDHSAHCGKTGIGVVIPNKRISMFVSLPHIKNSYKAECLALKYAILLAKELRIKAEFQTDHTGGIEDGLKIEIVDGQKNRAHKIARGERITGFKHIEI